ncbi:MAG: ATP-grasp domain-containing protein [Microcoleus sp. PH2017_10_PVI_O_A]|uniref:ATP-grasp domain-containing protein n=1 Tax=unclassified Microcoleus TaxID=2642155 RepID=UPI001D87312B|nr:MULTISPECIES: ATP-grasp domain-containing protein [unclassified Microcoleus]TAE81788.1 MAG: ATP-grasp domain-containing protein [Oscillatoriales cyanobacterium]MCC3406937.1 ATP-grasp domain-containing protein [Microcoleus sp. PH2017_10_PVI_O_A]MCC3461033.1 ATP-grasp domain-containing protein [Microcoleus sp. PH2017_11_PCY_U_A]MCC3479564.1 ATP-grasp domain-containing protein [Microcoleus sp. PH2017_12_PCY_D_A]MCC3526763.1 ATP-grasp domain-containing protein [Microcoleus sp. PH2017_21_RUC_O_A
MNVFLTCAGRRNYLLKFFQEALGNQGKVFAGDATIEAPTLQEADESFLLPRIDRSEYFEKLLDICQQKQVRLLIPLNDLELPYLAKQRDRFLTIGTIPVVSSPEVIDICFDKFATFQFLRNIGISAPETYLSLAEARAAIERGEITFRLVVKPRWGSASIGIEYPEDDEELELAYRFVKKSIMKSFLAEVSSSDRDRCILIQERLIGQEHGLDIINNLDGSYITTFVKRKLTMGAGETDRAVTLENQELKQLGEKIGQKLGHIGNLDCDVIVGQQGLCVLELNPRFGGGYPFSQMAGANIPAALIAWANGEEPDPSWLTVQGNITSFKCDRLVTVRSKA